MSDTRGSETRQSEVEDLIPVNFVLLSFVTPLDHHLKFENIGMKVCGAFNTFEDAQAHADRLMEVDPFFDVAVAPADRWLMIPPHTYGIEKSQEEVDDYLTTLLEKHEKDRLESISALELYKKCHWTTWLRIRRWTTQEA